MTNNTNHSGGEETCKRCEYSHKANQGHRGFVCECACHTNHSGASADITNKAGHSSNKEGSLLVSPEWSWQTKFDDGFYNNFDYTLRPDELEFIKSFIQTQIDKAREEALKIDSINAEVQLVRQSVVQEILEMIERADEWDELDYFEALKKLKQQIKDKYGIKS